MTHYRIQGKILFPKSSNLAYNRNLISSILQHFTKALFNETQLKKPNKYITDNTKKVQKLPKTLCVCVCVAIVTQDIDVIVSSGSDK